MSNLPNFPTIRPSLLLDFANSKQVDPRITFTRASTATYFDAQGVLRTAASVVPRIDHDPTTGECKGLLVEEARTNLLTYSEQFDNAAWGKVNGATVTANTWVAPDGSLSGDLLAKSTATNASASHSGASTAGTVYCGSVHVKAGSLSVVSLALLNSTSSTVIARGTINLSTGALNNTTGSGLLPVIQVGNGVLRCSIQGAATDASTRLFVYPGVFNEGIAGDIGVWGAQLEAGAFPTSYIPTTSAAATRAADGAIMSGTNFSEWYRQDEGTFVVESSTSARTATDKRIIAVNNGTVGHNMSLHYGGSSGGVFASVITTSGVFQFGPTESAYAADEVSKRALAYMNGNPLVVTNGVLSNSAGASATVVPTGLDRLEIGCRVGAQHLNGQIRRIAYYPLRLANAELQAITA